MNEFLLTHLWQSTLFALAAGLITLLLRRDGAAVRFRLWAAASLKFLLPFQGLTLLGEQLHWQPIAIAPAALEWLSGSAVSAPPPASLLPWLWLAWGAGSAGLLLRWAWQWRQVRRLLEDAVPLPMASPIPVLSVTGVTEPALVGIFRPVILMPSLLSLHLSPAQRGSVLAHELAHWRRRDNAMAALHMTVQALFWFHPLVWWVGRRLAVERERACDEAVLWSICDPLTYAEAILKVCKLTLGHRWPAVAGVSGGPLKQRVEAIMKNQVLSGISVAKKLMLSAAGCAAIAAPVLLGAAHGARAAAPDMPATINPALACKKPQFPNGTSDADAHGPVTVALLINPQGKVLDSKIEQSSGSEQLDRAALEALSLCGFNPAKAGGEPIEGWARIKYTWKSS